MIVILNLLTLIGRSFGPLLFLNPVLFQSKYNLSRWSPGGTSLLGNSAYFLPRQAHVVGRAAGKLVHGCIVYGPVHSLMLFGIKFYFRSIRSLGLPYHAILKLYCWISGNLHLIITLKGNLFLCYFLLPSV